MQRRAGTPPKASTLGYTHYALYGLERVGAFLGTTHLGSWNWYESGARRLLATQRPNGAWSTGDERIETCFAVLFLARATSGGTVGVVSGEEGEAPEGPLALGVDGDGPVRVWIERWNRRALRQLEWAGERGLGAHVASVEYFVDGELAAVKLGLSAQPARRERFAAELHIPRVGAHELRARVTLRTDGGSEVPLEAGPVTLAVRRSAPPPTRIDAGLSAVNLAPKMAPVCAASSELHGASSVLDLECGARLVFDGNPRTPWLATADDDERRLEVRFGRPRRCTRLRLRGGVLTPSELAPIARPVIVRATVNGRARETLTLSLSPAQPTEYVFATPTLLRSLEFEIVAASSPGLPVGLGEIELFAD